MAYKRLGYFIRIVNNRNSDCSDLPLLGVSIQKILMASIANTVGTDMSTYKIINRGQFAYGPVTSRNGDKISVALLTQHETGIVSQAYTVFEITNPNELIPEYLMMWFMRPEFDRYARFKSHGSAREIFEWEEMCNIELPVPSIEKQRAIVAEYKTITDRIKLNEQIAQNLSNIASAIFKSWFVDFEPFGGTMPNDWGIGQLEDVADIVQGQSPDGESYNENGVGVVFYQGRAEFGWRYPTRRLFTVQKKKMAQKNDILMSVRAPVGDINVATESCCIGRGLAAIRSKTKHYSFVFYLCEYLKFDLDKFNSDGTVFGSINRDELKELSIVVPSVKNLDDFEKIIHPMDKIIKTKCQEVEQLKKIKNLLLSKTATVSEE